MAPTVEASSPDSRTLEILCSPGLGTSLLRGTHWLVLAGARDGAGTTLVACWWSSPVYPGVVRRR